MEMTTAAKMIKQEIEDIVSTWGMSAILEVLSSVTDKDISTAESEDEKNHYRSLLYALKKAESLSD